MAEPTIAEVLDRFLEDQRARLKPRTFADYETVVTFLRDSLNMYAHESLSDLERRRWQRAFDGGDEEAFCRLFGPEKIAEHLGQFLGYFMVRKVIAGPELLRASGTVTKKLASWLRERGYLEEDAADDSVRLGARAARDLPRAEQLARLLYETAQSSPAIDVNSLPDEDYFEDYAEITRVEPGALWFDAAGLVKVPEAASQLAQVGWSVNVVLARVRGAWRLLEVGNVYPM